MVRKHRLRDKLQIAVIGGNGFLGRAIIHRLSSYDNLRIFSIDKRQHNVPIQTDKSRAIIQQITMDVGNEGAISSWFTTYPVDVIIFCAGYEHPTDGLSLSSLEDTKAMLALHRTLEGLFHMDLEPEEPRPYFMYLSSWSVYGPQKVKVLDETAKEYPGNHAGMSKLYAEDLVKRICTKFGSTFCILRPTEVYGRKHHNELSNKRFWPGYIPYFIDKVINQQEELEIFSPKSKLDFVPINYFTKVVTECIKDQVSGIINVSSGTSIALEDLVTRIIASAGGDKIINLKRTNRLEIESMSSVSNALVQEIVKFEPSKYDFDKFLEDYIGVRKFEIGKQLAIEVALKEPVTLDIAALEAKPEFVKRKKKREVEYKKIKEIAGPQFFEIRVGRLQERTQEMLGEEYTKDKKKADKLKKIKERKKSALTLEEDSSTLFKVTDNPKPKLINPK